MNKILIIDDSSTIRKSAEMFLKNSGCEVITADDGFSALPIIATQRPSLIFIDVMMPRLDGYQVCSLIKGNKDYANIPVIMLSAKESVFDRAKGRIAGSDEYLSKPFTTETLLEAVKRHLPV